MIRTSFGNSGFIGKPGGKPNPNRPLEPPITDPGGEPPDQPVDKPIERPGEGPVDNPELIPIKKPSIGYDGNRYSINIFAEIALLFSEVANVATKNAYSRVTMLKEKNSDAAEAQRHATTLRSLIEKNKDSDRIVVPKEVVAYLISRGIKMGSPIDINKEEYQKSTVMEMEGQLTNHSQSIGGDVTIESQMMNIAVSNMNTAISQITQIVAKLENVMQSIKIN